MRPRLPGAPRYRAPHRSITPSTHGFRPRGGRIHELEEEDMKISVIGCGYLGAVHAAAMAELGHEVVGVDVDPGKVEALSAARAPFFEPGFEELLARTLGTGRLRFSTDMAAAAGCAVHFVCVGTPQKRGEYAADLRYVQGARGGGWGCWVPVSWWGASPRCRWGPRPGWPRWWPRRCPGRCWPGIRSSSGRGSPSRTRCSPTGWSTGCRPVRTGTPRGGCSMRCTRRSWPAAPRRWSPTTRRRRW